MTTLGIHNVYCTVVNSSFQKESLIIYIYIKYIIYLNLPTQNPLLD